MEPGRGELMAGGRDETVEDVLRLVHELAERSGRACFEGGVRVVDDLLVARPQRLAHAPRDLTGRSRKARLEVGQDAPRVLLALEVDDQEMNVRAGSAVGDREVVAIERHERRPPAERTHLVHPATFG